MDKEQIKAIARSIWNIRREDEDRCDMEIEDLRESHSVFKEAEAAIESYKAELLKEVGEPVLYAEFAEDGGWLGDASECADHLEEPHALFTSDQVAAAVLKATKLLEDQLAAAQEEIAFQKSAHEQAQQLLLEQGDQLAKAEQRVSEACDHTAWISVTDALPKPVKGVSYNKWMSDVVLVIHSDRPDYPVTAHAILGDELGAGISILTNGASDHKEIAWYSASVDLQNPFNLKDKDYSRYLRRIFGAKITHWMPLPKAPNGAGS